MASRTTTSWSRAAAESKNVAPSSTGVATSRAVRPACSALCLRQQVDRHLRVEAGNLEGVLQLAARSAGSNDHDDRDRHPHADQHPGPTRRESPDSIQHSGHWLLLRSDGRRRFRHPAPRRLGRLDCHHPDQRPMRHRVIGRSGTGRPAERRSSFRPIHRALRVSTLRCRESCCAHLPRRAGGRRPAEARVARLGAARGDRGVGRPRSDPARRSRVAGSRAGVVHRRRRLGALAPDPPARDVGGCVQHDDRTGNRRCRRRHRDHPWALQHGDGAGPALCADAMGVRATHRHRRRDHVLHVGDRHHRRPRQRRRCHRRSDGAAAARCDRRDGPLPRDFAIA